MHLPQHTVSYIIIWSFSPINDTEEHIDVFMEKPINSITQFIFYLSTLLSRLAFHIHMQV